MLAGIERARARLDATEAGDDVAAVVDDAACGLVPVADGVTNLAPHAMLARIETRAGSDVDHDRALIAILVAAHAGELAAAYAYRGHWRSRWGPARWDDCREIQRIEAAEWHHRRLVHGLLDELGSGPVRWRELLMATIGRFFGALCFVGGRFGPMYAAGRLEAMNVGQYVDAAAHARAGGRVEMAELIDEMVVEEARHEAWFGDQVRGHPLLPLVAAVGGWRPPAKPAASAAASPTVDP